MKRFSTLRTWLAALALGLSSLAFAPAASAGDPVIDAAKSRQVVGERIDGYLALITLQGVDPALKRKVDEINAKRRALYQDLAAQRGVTPAQVARLTGESQLAKARPGEKVMDETGRWVTK